MQKLLFKPAVGLSSKHLQTIVQAFIPVGAAPASEVLLVDIGNSDRLSCFVSTPKAWTPQDPTIVLIHGLGGSHASSYMVRMAKKIYARNDRVVRVNLRNCGSGYGLSSLPYCAGNSQDIASVIGLLKDLIPESKISLIGFSLGGNIALKYAAEYNSHDDQLDCCIAVCPSLDLKASVDALNSAAGGLYQKFYLRSLLKQAAPWVNGRKFSSIYDFDDRITGPLWGYSGADEYYQICSSGQMLSEISTKTHILLAADDPFVPIDTLLCLQPSNAVNIWTTDNGGHMGFLGRPISKIQWLDDHLLHWTSQRQ